MSTTLELPQVTLIAVSSIDAAPALRAICKSMNNIHFGSVKLLSSQYIESAPKEIIQHSIAPFPSISRYSSFMLKELNTYISTDFALVVQWDGFVIDPTQWDPVFLEYDYVGAPWPHFSDGYSVGNGGFSLRSRKLIEATANDAIPIFHPEDVGICRQSRPILEQSFQIRFAPDCVAAKFALERGADRKTFGFHGSFNFPRILDGDLVDFLRGTPDRLFLNRDGRDLCRIMAESRTPSIVREARRIARRLVSIAPGDRSFWVTLMQTHLASKRAFKSF